MVYDGTSSALNKSLWHPSFGLPMIELELQVVGLESYFGDIDLG